MKIITLLMTILLLFGCSTDGNKSKNNEENVEEKESVHSFANDIEVVSVKTGWFEEQRPQITIKYKNKSDKPIDEAIKVKYRFVENDEVFDEGFKYLHSYSDVEWDNGLVKTVTYLSDHGYPYAGQLHKVKAKVCFEDNTVIWEGDIQQKVIY